jgi:hypothetical protein
MRESLNYRGIHTSVESISLDHESVVALLPMLNLEVRVIYDVLMLKIGKRLRALHGLNFWSRDAN